RRRADHGHRGLVGHRPDDGRHRRLDGGHHRGFARHPAIAPGPARGPSRRRGDHEGRARPQAPGDRRGRDPRLPASPGQRVTSASQRTAGTAQGSAAPAVAWPALIDEARALAWLRKRLSGVEGARARLYHHPMLAASYEVRRRTGSASAHALVDLVGGRAYAAEPWEHIRFIPMEVARRTGGTAAAELSPAGASLGTTAAAAATSGMG